jgi:hypothetical protein
MSLGCLNIETTHFIYHFFLKFLLTQMVTLSQHVYLQTPLQH